MLKASIVKSTFYEKYIWKKYYSKTRTLCMDDRIDQLKKRLNSSVRNIRNSQDELEHLKTDKEIAQLSRVALTKQENNQPITTEEQEALSEIKETFSTFFDEEMEESDPEMPTSPEYKDRKRVNDVVKYINEEIRAHKKQVQASIETWNRTSSALSALTGGSVEAESSSGRVEGEPSGSRMEGESSSGRVEAESSSSGVEGESFETKVEGEPSSSRAEGKSSGTKVETESSETRSDIDTSRAKPETDVKSEEEAKTIPESSNKQKESQTSQTPGDFIDDLPKQHNPFDDIGDD